MAPVPPPAGTRTLDRARCQAKAHPSALDAALAAAVLVCMVAGSFVDPHGDNGVSWGLRTPAPSA